MRGKGSCWWSVHRCCEQARPSWQCSMGAAGGLSWDGLVWLLADLVLQMGCSHTDLLPCSMGHGFPPPHKALSIPLATGAT